MPDEREPILLPSPRPAVVLSADWAGEGKKRSVWIADAVERSIRRCHAAGGWTLHGLLREAQGLEHRGSVLVAVDAVIGVPAPYFARRAEIAGWEGTRSLVDWLPVAARSPQFFESCRDASAWSLARPFFAIPKGEGGRQAFGAAAGFDFLRRVDRLTKANPLFAVSGIPGTVGSATREIWRELAALLDPGRRFRVWPFEGSLEDLLAGAPVVLAEMYPRVTYDVATDPGMRPVRIKKTEGDSRRAWIEALQKAGWIAREGVAIADVPFAVASEDDFDALFTAAAMLRRILEGGSLAGEPIDPIAEGGILLSGAIDSTRATGALALPLSVRG